MITKNYSKLIFITLFLFICTILFSSPAAAVQPGKEKEEAKKKDKKKVLYIDLKINAIFKDYQSMDSPGVARQIKW